MGAVVVLVWVACAALGYAVGNGKGRATEGLVLGLLLGVIGLIIVACLSPKPAANSSAPFPLAHRGYGQPAIQQPPVQAAMMAQWLPDPVGTHQLRWWNGSTWSENVSDNGVASVEVPGAPLVGRTNTPSFGK